VTLADGVSVTETPERGSVLDASAPINSPTLGHRRLTSALGVGTTVPVELRPLPVAKRYGQGGARK